MVATKPKKGTPYRRVLQEQRQDQVFGGLYQWTQVALAYHSNRIEGSELTEMQVRSLYDTGTARQPTRGVDIIEALNSFNAVDWVLDHVGEPVTADTLKTLHRFVKAGTPQAFEPDFNLGEWKSVGNVVGGVATTSPELVDEQITALLKATPKRMTIKDIARFHYGFEAIHPFTDGNGRVGRLVAFKQCLDNDLVPFVLSHYQRGLYYLALGAYKEEPRLLEALVQDAQNQFLAQYGEYVPHDADLGEPRLSKAPYPSAAFLDVLMGAVREHDRRPQ